MTPDQQRAFNDMVKVLEEIATGTLIQNPQYTYMKRYKNLIFVAKKVLQRNQDVISRMYG